ncbi:MAG TPA: hypothetical protein VGQ52_07400 [Gemmatimonadaceae bacterium]|nr:hypothetical protein [Gemmatimonadaceae bacterium]
MLRRILAIVAGLVAAMAIIFAIEAVGRVLFPLPSGMALTDPQSMRERADMIPVGALASILVAWTVGALAGSYSVARLIGARGTSLAYVAGGVVLVWAALMTMRMPHPIWFVAATPILIVGATIVGASPNRARRPKVVRAQAK